MFLLVYVNIIFVVKRVWRRRSERRPKSWALLMRAIWAKHGSIGNDVWARQGGPDPQTGPKAHGNAKLLAKFGLAHAKSLTVPLNTVPPGQGPG